MPRFPSALAAPIAAALLLAGCFGLDPVPEKDEGGDGRDLDSTLPLDSGDPLDSAEDGNRAPTADAGADTTATVGFVVALDGSDSSDPDGDPLTYSWRFVSKPGSSSATLVDGDRRDPQFVPDVEGRYEVGLTVSDGAQDSVEDSVEVTVTTENGAPVANAGRDQAVSVGATVNLDGSASSDPDVDALQFAWTLVSRPSGSSASLTSSTSAIPRFVADVAGVYDITLTVSDGTDVSASDGVRVTAADDGGGGGSDAGCGCRAGSPSDALGSALLVALAALAHRRPRR